VDDDREQHVILRELLGHCGYTTAHAFTLEEARAILATDGADLIILDVRLAGGVNGLDLLYALHLTGPAGIPVLVCTSDTLAEFRYPAATRAVGGWLIKPCALTEMLEAVDRVMRGERI
jgi:DNA-binding response OmpR family regulator